jgi:predicted anti-sigma-YlaC factor YlaD
MASFARCPQCREMIDSFSTQCRHCGAAVSPQQMKEAVQAQERVDAAIRQANLQRHVGWSALAFVAVQVGICIFAPRVPVYWFLFQLGPPVALFTALKWIRTYGALVTDERDYPAARDAVTKVMTMWAVVFAIQVLLLVVLGLRLTGVLRF